MTIIIIIAMILGIIFGRYVFPQSFIMNIKDITNIVLFILIFLVGLDIGSNKKVLKDAKDMGLKVIIIPVGIIIGSLCGGLIGGMLFKMHYNESLSVAAGFGWYSLSGILLTEMGNAELGAIAFLSNVFREILAIISIPIIAKRLNHYTAIAPCGATSMDTTLPIVSKFTNSKVAIISLVNGVILSMLVPVCVQFFYNL
ncbi:lysine exporter LysO family protein [Clostridium ihumii]|uniref:lysine exporter LysO family protein n=1 Tax=Clostridium ihumii TaxID=1470356 RepID=UPI003D358343